MISSFLPFKMEPLTAGFKYLGYYLNPFGYGIRDWHWLIKKIESRIRKWKYRLLSLGGRLILVNSVLMVLAVYWLSLARIPIYIITHLQLTIFNFLWGNNKGNHRAHLVDWQTLSRPYAFGGWNIKNLDWLAWLLD